LRRARKLVLARRLDDIPPEVRIGSPTDAPDRLVLLFAKRGLLHPATNYGVVYRVAFLGRMEPNEEPASDAPPGLPVEGMPTSVLLRFGWVVPPERFDESAESFSVSQKELDNATLGAWILLTNQGVRWHYTGDGVPQLHPGLDTGLGAGVRRLRYADLRGKARHNQIAVRASGRNVPIDLFIFDISGAYWAFGFVGTDASENNLWCNYVVRQADSTHP